MDGLAVVPSNDCSTWTAPRGGPRRRVFGHYAALSGIGVGVAASEPLARRLVATFDSDLFAMPFVWSWPAGVCLGAALVALLLTAQIPALRTVARMNLATSVRSREG